MTADGTLYIADGTFRLRRVGPDGIINTIAGSGLAGGASAGPASGVGIYGTADLAVGPDGSLYLANHCLVQRLGPDGNITVVAGTGACAYSGDGGPATLAGLKNPQQIAVAADGSVYIADSRYNFGSNYNYPSDRIRRVDLGGTISTVVGTGQYGYSGDGGAATQATLKEPFGVAVSPDGSLYIADFGALRIRRVQPAFPGLTIGDYLLPSDDATQVYHFDPSGRHLSTLNAVTGATLFSFVYDTNGKLVTITDGDGNITTIEHDNLGNSTAIVGPFGQRTVLATTLTAICQVSPIPPMKCTV